MTKGATIKKLEAILDALNDSRTFCVDATESAQTQGHYNALQEAYFKIAGSKYYRKQKEPPESSDYVPGTVREG